MEKWSLAQTVRGPVLSIPYIERTFNKDGKEITAEIRECYILPKTLNINGEIFPQERKRSIYETVVYESEINVAGQFDISDFNALKISPMMFCGKKQKYWWPSAICVVLTTGFHLTWNDSTFAFTPGMENKLIGNNGISLLLPNLSPDDFPCEFHFSLTSERFRIVKFCTAW